MSIDPTTLSKEQLLELYLNEKKETHDLKCNISGWDVNGEGISSLSDTILSSNIKKKIPDFTFESVTVTTIQHAFFGGTTEKTARLIVLKRTEGFFGEFFKSFFSVMWNGSSSVYAKSLDDTTICKYLLESKQVTENQKLLATEDLKNAYFQCKTIKIWVPNDLKHEAKCR